ncbi:hypothetical protein ACFWYW_17255 [Nonomuraea sp. NPDC059023]|uniref:restriction endonuclease-related protein n=1 Tax=unclassified Nonomuraea TaxID=2593643 RepID=UPI00369FE680
MNDGLGPLARPVTAAIRAGHAWSVRHQRSESWREMARMTGVIMRYFRPGQGPGTPAELIPLLRLPLGTWLPVGDQALAGLVILGDDDRLTDATYDIGCAYTVELLAGQEDPGARWLPSWRTHRAEQVENAVFRRLLNGTDEDYTAGRRFLVEHPAGATAELLTWQAALGVQPSASYGPIPHHQQWNGWWWPCPLCRWPMSVTSSALVKCRFAPHEAVYTLLSSGRLQPVTGAPRITGALPVQGAACVDESTWRYIVVPGAVEVRLNDRINALPGVSTRLYPDKDRCDIAVHAGERELTLDVKDYGSATALAARLSAHPIAADLLVLPQYRREQLPELRRLLPGPPPVTEEQIYRRIRKGLS